MTHNPSTSDPAAVCPFTRPGTLIYGRFCRCNRKSRSAIWEQKTTNGRHPATHNAPQRLSLSGPMYLTYPNCPGCLLVSESLRGDRTGVLLGRWAKFASGGPDAISLHRARQAGVYAPFARSVSLMTSIDDDANNNCLLGRTGVRVDGEIAGGGGGHVRLALAVIRAVRASRKKSGAVGAGSRRGRWRGSLDAVVTAGEWTNTHRKWHAKRHGRGPRRRRYPPFSHAHHAATSPRSPAAPSQPHWRISRSSVRAERRGEYKRRGRAPVTQNGARRRMAVSSSTNGRTAAIAPNGPGRADHAPRLRSLCSRHLSCGLCAVRTGRPCPAGVIDLA